MLYELFIAYGDVIDVVHMRTSKMRGQVMAKLAFNVFFVGPDSNCVGIYRLRRHLGSNRSHACVEQIRVPRQAIGERFASLPIPVWGPCVAPSLKWRPTTEGYLLSRWL